MTHYCFVSTKYRHRSTFILFTVALAFVVILLGAYTRLTDAGLSCPDWPHCYGYLTAPHTKEALQQAALKFPGTPVNIQKAWTEMTHRYFAGTEGIFILVIAFSILFTRKKQSVKSIFIGLSLVALLFLQVMLGMLTVTEKLKPFIVLAHLLTGLSLLSLLWWAYLDLPLRDDSFMQKAGTQLKPWMLLGILIIAGQITLGGLMSTHYAGLACIDFPYCNGELLPALHFTQPDLVTLHMLHRIGAIITAVYLIILGMSMLKNPIFRMMGLFILFLLCSQLILGILNIIWLRPVAIALTHHAIAILLLLTMLTAYIKAHFESQDYRYGSWNA